MSGVRVVFLVLPLLAGLGGCVGEDGPVANAPAPAVQATGDYGPVPGERFPVPALDERRIGPDFRRAEVAWTGEEGPGTVVVDPDQHHLYFVQEGGRAVRYGVAVGRQGFAWSGTGMIGAVREWPDWHPTKEMLERRPDIAARLVDLPNGPGVAPGPENPLGARGMYIYRDGKDTLFRIHGTPEPYTVGTSVSSGCIRMTNQDAIDLYSKVRVGTRIVVRGPDTLPRMAGPGVRHAPEPEDVEPRREAQAYGPDEYAPDGSDAYR